MTNTEYKEKLSTAFQAMDDDTIIFKAAVDYVINYGRNVPLDKGKFVYYPVLREMDCAPYNTWGCFTELFPLPDYCHVPLDQNLFWCVCDGQAVPVTHKGLGPKDCLCDLCVIWEDQDEVNQYYKVSYSNSNLPILGVADTIKWELIAKDCYGQDEFMVYFAKYHLSKMKKAEITKVLKALREKYVYKGVLLPGTGISAVTAEKGTAQEWARTVDWNTHTNAILNKYSGQFISKEEVGACKIIKDFCGVEFGCASLRLPIEDRKVRALYALLLDRNFISSSTDWETFNYYITGKGPAPSHKICWQSRDIDFYATFEFISELGNSERQWTEARKIFITFFSIGNEGFQSFGRSDRIWEIENELKDALETFYDEII